MPNLDKTGPAGQGPKSGRGLGNCDTSDDKKDSKKPSVNKVSIPKSKKDKWNPRQI